MIIPEAVRWFVVNQPGRGDPGGDGMSCPCLGVVRIGGEQGVQLLDFPVGV